MRELQEKYIRGLIRDALDFMFDECSNSGILSESKAGEETNANLSAGNVKRVNNRTDRGTPFYTFGATTRMLKSFTNKIEEHIAFDFKEFVFTKDVKIEHVKGEVIVYDDSKQILTVNINPDRLKPSFVRFDFCKPKLKIKIPMNIIPNSISMIIHDHRDLFAEYGILNVLKF